MDKETSSEKHTDHSGVKIPPPLCFLFFLIIGIYFDSNWTDGELGPYLRVASGAALAVIALFFTAKEAWRHEKSGSNVEPWKPTTLILKDGLYKHSRNPIYVGIAICYGGFSLAAGSWLAAALLPFALLIIQLHVIAREEIYLEEKFGDEYLNYKARVRRWL